ncbi:hypothetical protein COCNU_03G005200 [Cocos nucifera]|uniref:Uncharacterized protein n=1 Tax=Cocos nucifera TaxID=13894 RepID=A0A8K0I2Y7_COCNU|nr:hypothetical protein COCNU_03G005200 [Cocos nucifera]
MCLNRGHLRFWIRPCQCVILPLPREEGHHPLLGHGSRWSKLLDASNESLLELRSRR